MIQPTAVMKPIIFQCVTWEGRDELLRSNQCDEEEDSEDYVDRSSFPDHIGCAFVVKIFGRDCAGNTVQVVINDFRPYFYIKVQAALEQHDLREVRKWMSKLVKAKSNGDQVMLENVTRKDVWGFQNGEMRNFLRVVCFRQGAIRKIVRGFSNSDRPHALNGAKLYESNLDPVLRMLHVRDLPAAGWIQVSNYFFDPCNQVYHAKSTDLHPVTDDSNLRSPLLVAAFDIECFSKSGNFPVACVNCVPIAQEFVDLYRSVGGQGVGRDFIRKFFSERKSLFVGLSVKEAAYYRERMVEDVAKCVESMQTRPVSQDQFLMTIEKIAMRCLATGGDPVCQIGMTVHAYGDPPDQFRFKGIVTLGECNDISDDDGIRVVRAKTEADLFLEWAKMVRSEDPDMLTGYNIFGFDMAYLYRRMTCVGVLDKVCGIISREGDARPAEFVRKTLASSALGDNELQYFDIPGRTCFDLMKIVQRDFKLESYKLDSVAEHFTGQNKHDVSPQEIFAAWLADDEHSLAERARVAKYCVQDCALCNYLVCKLNIVANTAAMATVCSVPVKMIHLRGQGIKLQSLVFKQCHVEGACFPASSPSTGGPESHSDEVSEREVRYSDIATPALRRGLLIPRMSTKYEGATVLTPVPGVYTDPVCVNDFASLYPSSMISENISHDTLVMDSDFDDLPGVTYNEVSFMEDRTLVRCRFAESYEGILPRILKKLLTARKETRAKAKFVKVLDEQGNTLYMGPPKGAPSGRTQDAFDDFQKTILDGYQLALKVCANSLYGQCGASTSPIYLKPLAACTTATGRSMLQRAKTFMEDRFGAKVIYGDSVAEYTPVYVRIGDVVELCEIQDIAERFGGGIWLTCGDKESCELPGAWTWTEEGWTPLQRVIRHRLASNKRMIRITTGGGTVDVTDDHSLLLWDGTPISPKDLTVGAQLLHSSDLPAICSVAPFRTHCDHLSLAGSYWASFRATGELSDHSVHSISVISYEGSYVYDLTTTNHHFSAGIGRIVVHNTDSVFQIFPPPEEVRGDAKKMRQYSINIAVEASKEFRKIIKDPHDLEYEKCFHPMIIFSRKRYAAIKYEFDVDKGKMSSMGIVLKRRDNAPIVKEVYGTALNIILDTLNVGQAIKYVQDRIEDIVQGSVDVKSLVVSKTLRKDYKNPESIAHKVLADRVAKREPGNAFQCNDRVPYVHIVNKSAKLVGYNIETPDYVRAHPDKCKIDYEYYVTNQISKPLCQLMALVVEQIPGFRLSKDHFDRMLSQRIEVKRSSLSLSVWKQNEAAYVEELISSIQEEKEKYAKQLIIDRPMLGKQQTTMHKFFTPLK